MEMPELNEDILGEPNAEVLNQTDGSGSLEESSLQPDGQIPENADASQEKLDEGTPNENGETGEKVPEQQEEGEDTLDDMDLPKDDSIQGIQHGDGQSEVKEEKQDEDGEPATKKQKFDDQDAAIAEHLKQLDQQTNQQQQEIDQNSEAQPPEDYESKFQPEMGENPEMMDVDKSSEEPGKTLVKKEGEKQGAGPDTDMLATLASAALEQDPKDKNTTAGATPKSPIVKNEPEQQPKKKPEMWCNVGVFDTNTTIVSDYLATPEPKENVDLVTATLGGHRIQLEPGTAYKFRVCAVNGCGTGPWSDVAAFKTTLPGFPGAPSAIKISKSPEGAHLTWEPPGGNSGDILEYAVYLAVRSASQGCQPVTTNQAQLAFVRVFCGPTNKCMVGTNSLQAAHIDTTTKPAIIFRIAAKNSKGYGPATQVRWLQESQNGTTPGVKRAVKS